MGCGRRRRPPRLAAVFDGLNRYLANFGEFLGELGFSVFFVLSGSVSGIHDPPLAQLVGVSPRASWA